ncbi:TauE/SafE family permease protein [Rhizobium etli 8C-3]|uniref:Probable membrane transporter protein n=1 Tax=Rhizobium etli 8C-3 TaxID=538025 RepID=A0A1L5P4M0_RHIET|nr:sulfite exporter TauE/SafE family protein [Rhizobium etli]APO75081.1 TauE/SafE family permease protein [Rhizobium etli 8C-3]
MPALSELALFAPMMAAAGAVAGLLAGLLGIGGGAILVPVFYQVFGLLDVPEAVRMHLSVGTSLAIIVPTSLRSYMAHRNHGAVDQKLLNGWIIAVPLGAIVAAVIASEASSVTLRFIFATVALVVALRMLFNRASWRLGSDLPDNPFKFLVGTGIGILSGLMGIGGGVLNNTFMTLFSRPMHQAVATSAGVGVLISLPGLFGYAWAGWGVSGLPPFSTGYVSWIAVVFIIPLTMYVAPIGARLAHRMSKRQLEIGFGIFLIVTAARFLISIYA